jgi:hypothetical protein
MKEIEQRLNSSLRPIQPAPEFIDKLYSRLTTGPGISIETRPRQYGFLVLVFGFVSGILLLWILRRL